MEIVSQIPSAPLDQYIECIIYFKDFMPQHAIERVVPTGHIYLIFEFDNIVRSTYNRELTPDKTFTKAWISGMHRNYINISAHAKSEMLVFKFKTGGALPFLHTPCDEMNEQIVPAEQVLGEEIWALRDSFSNANTFVEKLKLAEVWLTDRFQPRLAPSAELTKFIKGLEVEPIIKFIETIKNYSTTQKQLIKQFKKYVGLTPKRYQRVVRFNEILARVQGGERISRSALAYECGYADQSHFIKEFYKFSGFRPKEFDKKELAKDELHFIPLE